MCLISRHPSVARILTLAWIAASALACRSDPTSSDLVDFGLVIRSSIPADSLVVDVDAPFDMSFRLNRPATAEEFRLRCIPPPRSAGEPWQSGSSRTWVWPDLQLSESEPLYRILFHGPRVTKPQIVHLFTTMDVRPDSSIAGRIRVPAVGPESPLGTIVFGYDPRARDIFGDPGGFLLEEDPLCVDFVEAVFDDGDGSYHLSTLHAFKEYVIFAVLDSDEDGEFDPRFDWWGYYNGDGGSLPVSVIPGAGEVDIDLGPPR